MNSYSVKYFPTKILKATPLPQPLSFRSLMVSVCRVSLLQYVLFHVTSPPFILLLIQLLLHVLRLSESGPRKTRVLRSLNYFQVLGELQFPLPRLPFARVVQLNSHVVNGLLPTPPLSCSSFLHVREKNRTNPAKDKKEN